MGIFKCISAGNVVSTTRSRSVAKHCLNDYSFVLCNETNYYLSVQVVARNVARTKTTSASGKLALSSTELGISTTEETEVSAPHEQLIELPPNSRTLVMSEEEVCYLSISLSKQTLNSGVPIRSNVAVVTTRIAKYVIRDVDVRPRWRRALALKDTLTRTGAVSLACT